MHKARDTHLDRFDSIKALPRERVPSAARKQRLVQEAKAAPALNHPTVSVGHGITADAGHGFMVMKSSGGRTLDQLIPRKGMRLKEVFKTVVLNRPAFHSLAADGRVGVRPDAGGELPLRVSGRHLSRARIPG